MFARVVISLFDLRNVKGGVFFFCYRIEHFAGRPHGPPLPPSSVTTGSCRRAVTAGSGSDADAVAGAGEAPVLESL